MHSCRGNMESPQSIYSARVQPNSSLQEPESNAVRKATGPKAAHYVIPCMPEDFPLKSECLNVCSPSGPCHRGPAPPLQASVTLLAFELLRLVENQQKPERETPTPFPNPRVRFQVVSQSICWMQELFFYLYR